MLRTSVLALSALGLIATSAGAVVVIPNPPKEGEVKPSASGKKGSKTSAPAPSAAPAPAVNPLLVRRRGAPPARASEDYDGATRLARGQSWAVSTVGSDASSCAGVLRITAVETQDVFAGPFQLTCTDGKSSYSYRQEATLMDAGDSIVVSLRAPTGAAQAPRWTQLRLTKQGPGHLSGAASDGPRTAAITLRLGGS